MDGTERGDHQTPLDLARAAVDVVARLGGAPAHVIEPTCGRGTFLRAAAEAFPRASLWGWEILPAHVRAAKIEAPRARIARADFFETDWRRELAKKRGPILVLGNPPWVTSAVLGSLGSFNVPEKTNAERLSGLDARTGKSNFDISEWMLLRLCEAIAARPDATLAMLVKTKVARNVIAKEERLGIRPGALYAIDARAAFGASVDAVLFVCRSGASRVANRWPVFASLDAKRPRAKLGAVDGVLTADIDGFERTRHLAGDSEPVWRSGIKHDCARVMELSRVHGHFVNGFGERVAIEEDLVFPLRKSSDVATAATKSRRWVIVPQRRLGEDTLALRKNAPRAWSYLEAHRDALAARKSSVYRGQPAFAIFGVGPYSFAPWKVAVSGLYKRWQIALLAPESARPVMVDDTCYFLPFTSRKEAQSAVRALTSPAAKAFVEARIFWDDKRPIVKSVLQTLDLNRLR